MAIRGRLRVYLGAAPGVGKTYAMLGEGHRRAARGTDVVVGVVDPHGRPRTAALLDGLEAVQPRHPDAAGAGELDVDAVLARRPQVVLVDELAHTTAGPARHERRWQDVEELLAAGIDVVTTVNIQHLASVGDVVEKLLGRREPDIVPDSVVRAADQVELVDMSPEALRRRLAHGNVYPPEQIDAEQAHYFRAGNLHALRELALLWTADRVEDILREHRPGDDATDPWQVRERVVVGLTGGPEDETLVRRASHIATRSRGDLLAVHVLRPTPAGRPGRDVAAASTQRSAVESLVGSLGGSYHEVIGDDVADALLTFARAEHATQLVLGDSRRSRVARLLVPGTAARAVRLSGDIDVHVVTHDHAGRGLPPPVRRASLGRGRRRQGFVLAVVLPPLLALLLSPVGAPLDLVSDLLLFLLLTVVVALVGGLGPALLAAVTGLLLLNYFFTPPVRTLAIREPNDALALVVFVLVAGLVSSAVDLAARRSRQAERAAAESRLLAHLAGSLLVDRDPLEQMLRRVRETFSLTSVTLLERDADGWVPLAHAGAAAAGPEGADTVLPAGEGRVLALAGRPLHADDRRLVGAFATQTALVLDHLRLRRAAAEAEVLAEATRVRTALLAAVGHDFRTPLAAAKAAVSTLLSHDLDLDEEDRRELLQASDVSLDRLTGLVDNLLDMSRLHAGALSLVVEPTSVEEVAARALDGLGDAGRPVATDLASDLPLVLADPGLLERVLANLVDNALRHSPASPPLLGASRHGDRVELRVVDRGPGIASEDRDRVFLPFQRLGDTDNTTGIGLGLALSRGLSEAMGGTLSPEDTPGGGVTMVVSLPVADDEPPATPGHRERDEASP